jgi:arabidopsis histidine kinase 2/3/4 (cytokinin receptor)
LVEELNRKINDFDDVSVQNRETMNNPNILMPCNTLSGLEVADSCESLKNFRIFKYLNNATDTVNLVLTIEDTGIGITKDAQMRIFTPFMQADSSTSRTYGGTGIGLSITKCLVELMGGEVGFTSKPGVGSTFSFTAVFKKNTTIFMENRKGPEDIKRYCSEPTPLDFQGMRALIVDGRCARAEITKYHLQKLGIQCDLVSTSESAFSALLDKVHFLSCVACYV